MEIFDGTEGLAFGNVFCMAFLADSFALDWWFLHFENYVAVIVFICKQIVEFLTTINP